MINYLTNKTYKAAGYVRLSVEDIGKNDESVSIKNQREIIQNYAEKNDINIVNFYVDDGYSGGDFERPGFKKLIEDIEKGIINCVITKDMSRLGREFIETGNYVFKYFPEHDVRYIAILENYDSLHPNGIEDILPFKAVINDMYIKDISKKIKSVMHEKMAKGEFLAGTPPYGYKRAEDNNKKLIIDEYAAEIVKKIFKLKDEAMSDSMIARTLTDAGILPPNVYNKRNIRKTYTTNIWKSSTINTMIHNKIYIGTLIQAKYQRVSLKSKKKRLAPASKWIVVENAFPSIIEKDLFERVNAHRIKSEIRYRKYDYLLKGLVFCADCGGAMTTRRVKGLTDKTQITPIYLCKNYARYRNGVCSMHYFREEELNNIVINEIRNVIVNYNDSTKLKDKYKNVLCNSNVIKSKEQLLYDYKKRIFNIDKAINNLYKDKVSEILSLSDFINIKNDLLEEKKEINNKVSQLEISINKTKNIFENSDVMNKYINDFLIIRDPSKKLIYEFVNKIEIDKEKKVKILFSFNISNFVKEQF